MCPFGHEDYGISQEREIVHAVTDLGELATRLGSPNAYNRSGNVVLLDSFEDGLNKWEGSTPSGGGSASLSVETAKNGLFAVKLVTTGAYPSVVQLRRGVGVLNIGHLGLEVSFSASDTNAIFDLYLMHYTGSRLYQGGIRVNHSDNTLYLLNSAGGWTALDTALVYDLEYCIFHTAKFTVNSETLKYGRLFLDSRSYTISGYDLYDIVSSAAQRTEASLQLRNPGAVVATGFLDDIILTQNEI